MIKLDIEPYCHDCPNFDAEQNRLAFYSVDRLESVASDCIISCKHKSVCGCINEYLRKNGGNRK